MKKTKSLLYLLILCFCFQNCAPGGFTVVSPSLTTALNATSFVSTIYGKWGQTCELSDGTRSDRTYYMIFDQQTMSQKVINYNTINQTTHCVQPAYTYENTYSYTLSKSTIGTDIYNSDISMTSYSVTPQTTAAVDSFNSSTYLGFSDWKLNVTKQIPLQASTPGVHLQEHDIVEVKSDKLIWGDRTTGDALTPTTRPTKINTLDYDPRM